VNIEELPTIASREFMGGTVVSLADDGGSASVRFEPPEGMCNPHGGVQGGFAAAMIDDVVSMATYFAGRQRMFVTTSISCVYLQPVPMGVPLIASCALVRVGKRQAVFDAELHAEGNDEPLVHATQIQQYIE